MRKLPTYEVFVEKKIKSVERFLAWHEPRWEALAEHRDEMPPDHRRRLIASFRSLIKQADKLVTKLEQT